ncbi:MAG: methyltransferase [Mycoplasmoidaceae bacterium]
MTINKLICNIKIKYPTIVNYDLYQLIFFLSKKIKNSDNLNSNLMRKIDFDYNKLEDLVNQLILNHKPIERIIGFINVLNLKIHINNKVFCPREETIYWCQEWIKNNGNLFIENYLDLCSGSGVISILFKKGLLINNAIGIDINPDAIALSNENAKINNLIIDYQNKSVVDFISQNKIKFDLITCNPPYIAINDSDIDPSSLNYDPFESLFAPENGYHFYNLLFNNLHNILNVNGIIILEIGFKQRTKLLKILKELSIKNFKFGKDQNNLWRYLEIRNSDGVI